MSSFQNHFCIKIKFLVASLTNCPNLKTEKTAKLQINKSTKRQINKTAKQQMEFKVPNNLGPVVLRRKRQAGPIVIIYDAEGDSGVIASDMVEEL